MRRFGPLVAVASLLAVAATTPAGAQDIIGSRDSLTTRVDNVFRAFDRTDGPGCAVGVYRDGRILYARGYGMANLEQSIAITPRTVFDIGSISKQFTAMAVELLAQDGRVRLDDPVRRIIPELPAYADSISLRRLLSHTSGVRDYLTLMALAGWNFEGFADSVDFLRVITRQQATNFPIGTRWLYSNSGYVLAATLVYRVSGLPLPRFTGERILAPLGMDDSRFHYDHGQIIPRRAQGYAPQGGGGFRIASSQFDNNAGAGGMHSTVVDFARWDRNYDSATVGSRAILDEMQTRARLVNDSAVDYGFGLGIGTYRGLRAVSHGGSWAGYRAQYVRFPDQHLSVACFCNVTNAGPDTLAARVAEVYLGAAMGPDTATAWEQALRSAPVVAASLEQLQPLAGVWRNTELGEVRRTRMTGDTLQLGIANRPRMIALGARRFRLPSGTSEARFEHDSGGSPVRLITRTRGGAVTWTRVPAAEPTAAQLAEYAGDYVSAELETTYAIEADSGKLMVRVRGRRLGAAWEPTYRDAFSSGSVYVDFQRDARGHIAGFTVSAGRVRDLRFARQR